LPTPGPPESMITDPFPGCARPIVDRTAEDSVSLPTNGVRRTEMAEDAARNGFACFLGRCYERDEPLPYLPFVQIIEAMLDQSPSSMSSLAWLATTRLSWRSWRHVCGESFRIPPKRRNLPPPQKRFTFSRACQSAAASGSNPSALAHPRRPSLGR
jgi:hypothetical protein